MSFHPNLLPDGLENTQSSAEPAHLRREMTRAEQVSQSQPNNILCQPQHQCFCSNNCCQRQELLTTQRQHISALTYYLQRCHHSEGSHITPNFPCVSLTSQCQPAVACNGMIHLKLQARLQLALKQGKGQSSCAYHQKFTAQRRNEIQATQKRRYITKSLTSRKTQRLSNQV